MAGIDLEVGTSMPGFHCWPGAPDHRSYLRVKHQHTFLFKIFVPVVEADREMEFHDLREKLEIILKTMFPTGDFGHRSCEMIAIELLQKIPEARAAWVAEDPNHGSTVYRDDYAVAGETSHNGRLHVVTVCGSTKFKDETNRALLELEAEGLATLSVGGFMHADSLPISPEEKIRFDTLHKDKIRMSDSIYVVNPDGYIGQSTAGEILLAWELGLPVRYRYPRFAVDPRPLDAFYARMGKKLLKNAFKGGWDDWTMEKLVEGIERELAELKRALGEGQSPERCADEAADVANYAMMVADRMLRRGEP